MAPTTTRPTGRRYITQEETDCGPYWMLYVDGRLKATAAATTFDPPFALTEGLPFVAQYESHVDEVEGIPTSWFYAPPRPASGVFWAGVALAAIACLASLATHPSVALIGAIIMLATAIREANL